MSSIRRWGLARSSPRDSFVALFALTTGLVGAALRLYMAISADFPLNDGGLFYTMLRELRQAHYALPLYTSYNAAQLPFAYPPFPFYVAALLPGSLLDILRILPAVVSVLTIPAFYLLARRLLPTPPTSSLLAVFAFTVLPWSYLQAIKGGGLTRSFGLLFALLTLQQAALLYQRGRLRFVWTTALFAALTVLSHPEIAWFAAYSAGLLFLFYGRSRRGFYHTLLVAASTLVLAAPWWLMVLLRYGPSPLLAALQSSAFSLVHGIGLLFTFNLVGGPFSGVLAGLGLVGLFASLAERRFFIPLWLVAIVCLEPRGELPQVAVALAMLIGVGVERLLRWAGGRPAEIEPLPVSRGESQGQEGGAAPPGFLSGLLPKAVLIYLFIHTLIGSWMITLPGGAGLLPSLSPADREALQWTARNTPSGSRFVVVTGTGPWWRDALSEWFPAQAERVSLTTVQGTEWLPDQAFKQREAQYEALQSCADQDVACLEAWSTRCGQRFTHVYIPRKDGAGAGLGTRADSLTCSLQRSAAYRMIYDGPGAFIFARAGED